MSYVLNPYLPWRPLPSHSHISELEDDDFSSLVQPAKRLDRHFRFRTGLGIVPVVYRLLRGWPILEVPLKRKETDNEQIGANNNHAAPVMLDHNRWPKE